MVSTEAVAQALSNAANRGLVDLDALELQCVAKILAGGGELAFTLTAGMNGKSGAQECRRDAVELLVIVDLAKSLPPTTGAVVGLTYSDFSSMR